MGDIRMNHIIDYQSITNGFVDITVYEGPGAHHYDTDVDAVHIGRTDIGALNPEELHIYLFGIELVQGMHYELGELRDDPPYIYRNVNGIGGGITGASYIYYLPDL